MSVWALPSSWEPRLCAVGQRLPVPLSHWIHRYLHSCTPDITNLVETEILFRFCNFLFSLIFSPRSSLWVHGGSVSVQAVPQRWHLLYERKLRTWLRLLLCPCKFLYFTVFLLNSSHFMFMNWLHSQSTFPSTQVIDHPQWNAVLTVYKLVSKESARNQYAHFAVLDKQKQSIQITSSFFFSL